MAYLSTKLKHALINRSTKPRTSILAIFWRFF